MHAYAFDVYYNRVMCSEIFLIHLANFVLYRLCAWDCRRCMYGLFRWYQRVTICLLCLCLHCMLHWPALSISLMLF